MKLYPDCDYFNDERDSEFAPDTCEECYRYIICKRAYDKEHGGDSTWNKMNTDSH